jgi:hypothetical protein
VLKILISDELFDDSTGEVFSSNDQLMIYVRDEAGPGRGNFHWRSSTHA